MPRGIRPIILRNLVNLENPAPDYHDLKQDYHDYHDLLRLGRWCAGHRFDMPRRIRSIRLGASLGL